MRAMLPTEMETLGRRHHPRGHLREPEGTLSHFIVAQRLESELAAVPSRRARIGDLDRHLHCSIIGTCLSAAELRQILVKVGLGGAGDSDHDLHSQGVALAGKGDRASKILNKALDQRHRLAINQFAKAGNAGEVQALWRDAVQQGQIPGAYWAVLTHPETTRDLVREVFGEVHMLSHLVGAANRADIRRLSQLDAENAELRAKLLRQQEAMREAVTSRDETIRGLRDTLATRIVDDAGTPAGDGSELATLTALAGDLERRVRSETRRRVALEETLIRLGKELAAERDRRAAAERREATLRDELDAVEASLGPSEPASDETAPPGLDGLSLLYVGGRPNQVTHIRSIGERLGATFLHHDGGIEDRTGLLARLVGRADIVMFPVDCVSHDAAGTVKRLCRQGSKPYLPLRSAAASSFIAALRRPELTGLRAES